MVLEVMHKHLIPGHCDGAHRQGAAFAQPPSDQALRTVAPLDVQSDRPIRDFQGDAPSHPKTIK